MACQDMDFAWKEFFKDPSQFTHLQNKKKGPDFIHRKARETLHIRSFLNPQWVQEELSRRSLIYAKTVEVHHFQDHAALLSTIKACGKYKDLSKGNDIYEHIAQRGFLHTDTYVASAMITMYARCNALSKAQQVFNDIPVQIRNVVTWNALISGHVQHGLFEEALNLYKRMQEDDLKPDSVTFSCVLRACGNIGAMRKGEEIHAEVMKTHGLLENNSVLSNALVGMYAKCGALAKARDVFDKLPARDLVSWNTLISGYTQHKLHVEALHCFAEMQDEGFSPDAITFACILKVCGSIKATEKGREIHAEVCKRKLLANNVMLGNAVVNMYAKCGVLSKAKEVFDKLPVHNVVSWNALIGGYIQHGLCNEALLCFGEMRDEGISPDSVTFLSILKACGSIRAIDKGEEIHDELMNCIPSEETSIVLGTALVDMYAKCGKLSKAQEVFDGLLVRDAVSWTALIDGYAQHGLGNDALTCFGKMQDEGISPNAVTFASMLKGCGCIGLLQKGEQIHAEVSNQGLIEKDIVLGNALVDMYAKCGALAKAQEVFDTIPVRDAISWTALITGYARYGLSDRCLLCFDHIQDTEGCYSDVVTVSSILKSFGTIESTQMEEIHDAANKQGLLGKYTVFDDAFVDRYVKCGRIGKTREGFDKLKVTDTFSWTALLAGYAQLGEVKGVFSSFTKMASEGIMPDAVTFIVLLIACSHAGLVEEGNLYFDLMTNGYGLTPSLEHYTCMIDLFGRAGHFEKAVYLIEKVAPSHRNHLWLALLGACRKWGNVRLGRWIFEHSVKLNENDASPYVCMSNIYATHGK